MQNKEKAAKIQFIIIFGVPSQTRVLDSRSNFFITASKSIGSSTVVFFFLENNNKLPTFLKND